MPAFSLAALWNPAADPTQVETCINWMATAFPAGTSVQFVVSRMDDEANLEIRIETKHYPRAAVTSLARQVEGAHGTFVELWRLAKNERDAFRAQALRARDARECKNADEAARTLSGHLGKLLASGVTATTPPRGIRERLGPPPVPASRAVARPPAVIALPPPPEPSPATPAAEPPPAPAPVTDSASGTRAEASAALILPPPPGIAPADSGGIDGRRSARFNVALELSFGSELEFVQEHATSISKGGLFIRTRHPPAVDTVAPVRVVLPNGAVLESEVLVVHANETGVGVAFLSEDSTFAAQLDAYLASLADPSPRANAPRPPPPATPSAGPVPSIRPMTAAPASPTPAPPTLDASALDADDPFAIDVDDTAGSATEEEDPFALSLEDPPRAAADGNDIEWSLEDPVTAPMSDAPVAEDSGSDPLEATDEDRLGPWALVRPLGKGALAEVFRARGRFGAFEGQEVALKVLLPERRRDRRARELLLQEAAVGQRLVHPNIVRVLTHGETGGVPWLAMELVDGVSLSDLLRACRLRKIQIPREAALHATHCVLRALDYAHRLQDDAGRAMKLVHCDVSPGNVLVSGSGEVKLGDFGVARVRDGISLTADQVGKLHYRSPELLRGDISLAADLWATGVMLYELLTLKQPFEGADAAAVHAAILAGRQVPLQKHLTSVPEKVEKLLSRALSSQPAQRFHTADEFARAVDAAMERRDDREVSMMVVMRALGRSS